MVDLTFFTVEFPLLMVIGDTCRREFELEFKMLPMKPTASGYETCK